MVKSLSERIALRVSTKKLTRIGKNRASFLAVRDDVKAAMDDGWPIKVIWDTLQDEGKIEFGYDAFMGYVNRLIRNVETSLIKPLAKQVEADKPAPKAQVKTDVLQELKKETPSIGGFNFNPTPNKEDLF